MNNSREYRQFTIEISSVRRRARRKTVKFFTPDKLASGRGCATCAVRSERRVAFLRSGRDRAGLGILFRSALLSVLAMAFPASAQQEYKYLEKLETPYVPTSQPAEGERISFTLIDDADYNRAQRFEGRVRGNTIAGTVRRAGPLSCPAYPWRATRTVS